MKFTNKQKRKAKSKFRYNLDLVVFLSLVDEKLFVSLQVD